LELVSKDSFLDLQKASVIGREFAYKLLQQLSNREEDILINYLEEFTDHRIIETLDRYGDVYRFCHGKIKEVVYKEIQAIRRRKLHIQAAELLEIIYQDQLIEFSSIISQHYSLGGKYDRAVKYLMMSGCKNAKVYANKEALSNYQEALVLNAKRIQSIETLKVEQELNFKIALVYREINNYSEANKYYKLALAITERINDQVSAAEIMNKQAETFAIRGEYEQAEDIYKKCLVLAEKLKLSELHLQLYNDFADLYWWKCQGLLFEGKTDEAANYMETIIDYTTKARKISEEIGDQESLVRSIKNIGNYYYLRGDNLKALEQFELCVELTEGHDLLSQKYVYEMVGRVYRLTGSFDKALDAYQKYLNWSLQIGAQWAQLKAYQVMGLVNLELQKYDEALTWLNKSLELNKVVLGYHEQIETLIVKGKTLELMGEMDKGFTCYAEALQVRGKEVELDNPELILKNVGIEMYSRQELEQAKYFIQRYLDYNPNLTKEEEELVKEIMQ
jgi:tetratricopeptide (TPR) repeat protein